MRTRSTLAQVRVLLAVILMNFAAQVPYFFHNHYQSQPLSISARSLLVMGSVFGFFLTASFLLFRRKKAGYPLMLAFLAVEFLFYLWGVIGSIIHGYGIFFQMRNPDVLLRIVFIIGYLNFAASGYCLILLLRFKHDIQPA